MRFLGYSVEGYKLFVFTLTAVIAALAGALYYPQAGIINPAELAPIASIYLAVWVAIGGRGRLYGAVIGAAFVSLLSSWFTGGPRARRSPLGSVTINWVDWWQVLLGLSFVAVTLFAPKGIGGLFDRFAGHRARPTARARRLAPMTGRCRNRRRRNERTSGGFRRLRHLRRLSRDQQPVLLHRPGRIARHHRAERGGQDHLHGHRHRQDPARQRHGHLRRTVGLAAEAVTRRRSPAPAIGRKFQRPTVFEDQTVDAKT